MLTLIDNYDSFTYNLVHFLGELGAQCRVYRNDKVSVDQVLEENPQAIILSPGPCTPNEAGICLDLVKRAAEGEVPLLGVCLGHQSIGQAFGGDIVRAPTLMHGKISTVCNTGAGIFTGLPPEFEATRYHSLTVKRETLPDCLEITAETDGVIMGLQHKKLPLHGVQFHPESIASQHGHALLANFLDVAGIKHEPAGPFDAAMAVM
jgi:anthranilate synthase component 2